MFFRQTQMAAARGRNVVEPSDASDKVVILEADSQGGKESVVQTDEKEQVRFPNYANISDAAREEKTTKGKKSGTAIDYEPSLAQRRAVLQLQSLKDVGGRLLNWKQAGLSRTLEVWRDRYTKSVVARVIQDREIAWVRVHELENELAQAIEERNVCRSQVAELEDEHLIICDALEKQEEVGTAVDLMMPCRCQGLGNDHVKRLKG